MLLEYLYIRKYKSLIDCKVTFVPQQGYPKYYYEYFNKNNFTVLVGENGSGKTTLMSFLTNIFKNLQRHQDRIKSDFYLRYKLDINDEIKTVILEKENSNVFITIENQMAKSLILELDLKKGYTPKEHQIGYDQKVTYDEIRKYLPLKVIASVFSMHGEYKDYHPRSKGDRIIDIYDISNVYGENHFGFSLSRGISRFIYMYLKNTRKVDEFLRILNFKFAKRVLVRSNLYTPKFYPLYDLLEDDLDYFDEGKKLLIEQYKTVRQFINNHSVENDSVVSQNNNVYDLNEWIEINERNYSQLLKLEQDGLIYINDLIFLKNDEQITLGNMSSGEKMFFVRILSLLSSVEDNSLIIIEEPELHLNPSWTKQIVTMLQMLFSEYKVHFLIATHSYAFINTVFPENILYASQQKFINPDPTINTFLANEVEINNRFFVNSKKRNYVENILWSKVKDSSDEEIKEILGYLGESYTKFKLFNILLDRQGSNKDVED